MFNLKIIKGAKNVSLRVLDGSRVRLSVPRFYGRADCERVIENHRAWIEQKLCEMRAKEQEIQNLNANGQILWFGQWRDVQDLQDFGSSVDEIKAAQMVQLLEFLQSSCAFWAQEMGLEFKSLKLSSARGFFGVCTRDNRLRFSKMLAFAPRELIEYVVIHELAHIRHKNHSRSFWALVGEFCPDFGRKRADLRAKSKVYAELLKGYE